MRRAGGRTAALPPSGSSNQSGERARATVAPPHQLTDSPDRQNRQSSRKHTRRRTSFSLVTIILLLYYKHNQKSHATDCPTTGGDRLFQYIYIATHRQRRTTTVVITGIILSYSTRGRKAAGRRCAWT